MDPVKRTGDGDRGSRAVLTGVVISYWIGVTERGRLLQKRRGDERDAETQRGVPQHRKDVKTSIDPTIKARETNLFF